MRKISVILLILILLNSTSIYSLEISETELNELEQIITELTNLSSQQLQDLNNSNEIIQELKSENSRLQSYQAEQKQSSIESDRIIKNLQIENIIIKIAGIIITILSIIGIALK